MRFLASHRDDRFLEIFAFERLDLAPKPLKQTSQMPLLTFMSSFRLSAVREESTSYIVQSRIN